MPQPEPTGQMFADWAPRPDRVVRIGWVPRVTFAHAETPPAMAYYSGAATPWAGTVRHYEMPVSLITAPVSEPWREGLDGDWLCQMWDKQGYAFDPVDRVMYVTPNERKARVRKVEGTENITVPWIG